MALFDLACPACSQRTFTVSEYKAGGEQAVGLALRCAGCQAQTDLFDARRDGYDGELGHNGPPAGPRSETPLKTGMGRDLGLVQVRVTLAYNVEFEELKEIADEVGKAPQDLFDWFSLDVKRGSRWSKAVWDYECA